LSAQIESKHLIPGRRGSLVPSRGRVAHVVSHYGVPSETFIPDAIEELSTVGWDPVVLAWSIDNRATFPFPPLERVHCPAPRTKPRVLFHKLRRYSGDARFSASLHARVAPLSPQIVHAHFGWAATHATRIAARLEAPLVVTFHGSDVTVFPHAMRWPRALRRGREPYRGVFERIDMALVVSRYVEGELRALGYDGPIEVIPAGVRVAKFPFRSEPPPNGQTRLIFTGRIVHRKGLHVLLQALPRLLALDPTLQLDVVGDGPERDGAERMAAGIGVNGRVRFHGTQRPDQVARLLERAHLAVVPSLPAPGGGGEGSPVVTKEALAVGVPVVATRSGGLPETIPPCYRQELVPENDPGALAEQVAAVLADRGDWAARARVGRRWVETEFDSTALALRTAEIYDTLAGREP